MLDEDWSTRSLGIRLEGAHFSSAIEACPELGRVLRKFCRLCARVRSHALLQTFKPGEPILRIICAWELGGNYGHLARLSAIVTALKSAGHDVSLALRDLSTISPFLDARQHNVLQAPVFLPRLQMNRPLVSMADVLMLYGFNSKHNLLPMIQAWQQLFRLDKTDLLVADHAPTALVAARILQVPTLVIGNGFTLPAAGEPLPDFRSIQVADRLIEKQDRAVVEVINAVLPKGMAVERISELYRCSGVLINSFPLLDIQAGKRKAVVYHADNPQAFRMQMGFSGKTRLRIAAYLNRGYGKLKEVCTALARLPAETRIVCPGANAAMLASCNSGSLAISTELVDMESLVTDADWLLSHGGLGVATQAMRLGKPQMILPMQMEQLNNGTRLLTAGLAHLSPELETAERFQDFLGGCLRDTGALERAKAFAQENQEYCRGTFAAAVLAAVTTLGL
jgi:uncharacterized protein (TIGR00661 family)